MVRPDLERPAVALLHRLVPRVPARRQRRPGPGGVLNAAGPGGSTRVAAVIGHPIGHSLSPALHNAAFRATGLDWVFVALPVQPGRAPTAVAGVRELGIAGLSVTMPHKEAVLGSLDRLDGAAEDLGAVNCIARDPDDDDVLVGHNTDGEGFLAGLAEDTGRGPDGLRCVVLGAGGAARAVVRALGGAGAAEVAVLARRPEAAAAAAALGGPVGRVLRAEAADEVVRAADLVVNATPVGMAEHPGVPLDVGLLRSGQVVVDLVYFPRRTPLLAAAASVGAEACDGVSMLVHQAAVAFRLWTGVPAPVAAMRAAVPTA